MSPREVGWGSFYGDREHAMGCPTADPQAATLQYIIFESLRILLSS